MTLHTIKSNNSKQSYTSGVLVTARQKYSDTDGNAVTPVFNEDGVLEYFRTI